MCIAEKARYHAHFACMCFKFTYSIIYLSIYVYIYIHTQYTDPFMIRHQGLCFPSTCDLINQVQVCFKHKYVFFEHVQV